MVSSLLKVLSPTGLWDINLPNLPLSLSLSQESGIYWWYDQLCLPCWISVARAVEQELLGLSQFRDCIQFGRWRLMMMLGNCCFCPRCDCSSGRNYFGLLGFSLAVDVAGEAGGCWVGKTTNTQCSTSCCFTQFRPTKVGNCRIHGPLGRLRAPASFFH